MRSPHLLLGSEHDHQVALFRWASLSVAAHPELRWLYAIPNGGLRNLRVALKLRAEGVKPGVLDVHLPVARNGFIGLWIEMKAGSNKPTEDQDTWIGGLRQLGHRVHVCYSWESASKAILEYLE